MKSSSAIAFLLLISYSVFAVIQANPVDGYGPGVALGHQGEVLDHEGGVLDHGGVVLDHQVGQQGADLGHDVHGASIPPLEDCARCTG